MGRSVGDHREATGIKITAGYNNNNMVCRTVKQLHTVNKVFTAVTCLAVLNYQSWFFLPLWTRCNDHIVRPKHPGEITSCTTFVSHMEKTVDYNIMATV